jgi:hypothetical protein
MLSLERILKQEYKFIASVTADRRQSDSGPRSLTGQKDCCSGGGSGTALDFKRTRLTNCMADRVPDSAVSFTWEVFQAARKPVSEAHNRQETPLLAKSIERHALRDK